jgi:hypothetical protein
MKYYGTKNNKDYGFYEENFENAIEITDEYWKELIYYQENGKTIIPYNNGVLAVNADEYIQENQVWRKLSKPELEEKHLKQQKEIRIKEINKELDELDKKRIRAIAEPSMKDEEMSWLEYYNRQIQPLREELQQLNN